MKRIFGFATAISLGLALSVAPVRAAETKQEPTDIAVSIPEASEINVSVSGSEIRVTGANKLTLTIYNLIGSKVASYAIDSDDQTISTSLSKGVYLVKVGKFVRKVSIS